MIGKTVCIAKKPKTFKKQKEIKMIKSKNTKRLIAFNLAFIMLVSMFPFSVLGGITGVAFPTRIENRVAMPFNVTESGYYTFRIQSGMNVGSIIVNQSSPSAVIAHSSHNVVSSVWPYINDFTFNLQPGEHTVTWDGGIGATSANLRMFTGTTPPQDFSITVSTIGEGWANADSPAWAGETIVLNASPNLARGYRFSHWEVISGNVTLSNATAANASFIMPSGNVSLRAVFNRDPNAPTINVTSNNFDIGFTSAWLTETNAGINVDLSATPRLLEGGMGRFVRWEVLSGNVNIDVNRMQQSFLLPSTGHVEILGIFEHDLNTSVTVTVNNPDWGQADAFLGSADGNNLDVMLWAQPNEGFEFYRWNVIRGNINISEPTEGWTNFILPASGHIEIQAVFRREGYVPTPTYTLFVHPQLNTLSQGTPNTVNFNITSTGIQAGVYTYSISNLPPGVLLRSSPGTTGSPQDPPFRVSIANDGTGRLQLSGSTATINRIWNNLRLNLYRDGVIFATSNAFTLTVGTPSQVPTQQWFNQAPPPQPTAITRVTTTNATISTGGVNVTARQSGANVTLALPTATVTQLINNSSQSVSFNLSNMANATSITIPADAASRFAGANLAVEMILPHASISMDVAAMEGIANQANGTNIQFSVQPMEATQIPAGARGLLPVGSQIYRIQIGSGGQNIANLGGQMSTSVPFSAGAPAAWRINPNGQLEPIAVNFNAQTGMATFTKNSLSMFAIGNDPNAAAVGFAGGRLGASGYAMRLSIGSVVFTRLGEILQNDVAPFIDPANNRTMVPLRIIAEGMGASVRFEDSIRTVFITNGAAEAHLTIDYPLPSGMGTPVIINDRTFVPLRYVSEILGAEVRWDEGTRAVYIYN